MEELIRRAITERRILRFIYSGEGREVEPHLLGINQAGTLILSGWQLNGREGWRAYALEKIGSLIISNERFSSTRPGYNPNDSTMSQVICRC